MRLGFALIVAFLALPAALQADPITPSAPKVYAPETSVAPASIDVASDGGLIESVLFAECDQPIRVLTPDYLHRLICADGMAARNPLVNHDSQRTSDDIGLTIYRDKLPYYYLRLAGR